MWRFKNVIFFASPRLRNKYVYQVNAALCTVLKNEAYLERLSEGKARNIEALLWTVVLK